MRYFSFFRFTALFGKGGEERLLAASQNALRDARVLGTNITSSQTGTEEEWRSFSVQ